MKKITFLIGTLFFALISFTNAQSTSQRGSKERPSPEELFTKMDTDNDGFIGEAEAKGPLQKNFTTIDANGDGYLSMEELENAPKPQGRRGGNSQNMDTEMGEADRGGSQSRRGNRQQPPSAEELFSKLDANGDGFIGEAEAKGPLRNNFADIDANGDGTISMDELENAPKPQGREGRGNRER